MNLAADFGSSMIFLIPAPDSSAELLLIPLPNSFLEEDDDDDDEDDAEAALAFLDDVEGAEEEV